MPNYSILHLLEPSCSQVLDATVAIAISVSPLAERESDIS
jgi:hypothetical protein